MKTSLIIIVIFLHLNASSQFVTSIAAGYETSHTAALIQLSGGINIGRSELVIGYAAFFHVELPHRNDGGLPQIVFLRYGVNILSGSLEIMPLIGAGMITPAIHGERLIIKDPTPVYELVVTPQQFKLLYGLKVQKLIGLGGIFASYENCKLSYLNIGMFVRID